MFLMPWTFGIDFVEVPGPDVSIQRIAQCQRAARGQKLEGCAVEKDFSLDLRVLALGGSLAHAVSQRILRKNPERPQVGKHRSVWG